MRNMKHYRAEASMFIWLCQICRNEMTRTYRIAMTYRMAITFGIAMTYKKQKKSPVTLA